MEGFMLWTVKQTSEFLNFKLHQVYYLLQMGTIEAVHLLGRDCKKKKALGIWRINPESVMAYKAKLAA